MELSLLLGKPSNMPIKTSTFGRVILSASAAKAFRKQFLENPKPNPLAKHALMQGL